MSPNQFLPRGFVNNRDRRFAKFQNVAVAFADYVALEPIIAYNFTEGLQPRCWKTRPFIGVGRERIEHVHRDMLTEPRTQLLSDLLALFRASPDDVCNQFPEGGVAWLLIWHGCQKSPVT